MFEDHTGKAMRSYWNTQDRIRNNPNLSEEEKVAILDRLQNAHFNALDKLAWNQRLADWSIYLFFIVVGGGMVVLILDAGLKMFR